MKLAALVTRTVARIATVAAVVIEAPAVHRELRQHRAAQATVKPELRPLTVDQIKGEIPTESEVIEAAQAYEVAKEAARVADRSKRKAERVLSRTPDGAYGVLTLERHASTRQVADLDTIRALFQANGLGDIPMKTCNATLALSWAQEAELAAFELIAA